MVTINLQRTLINVILDEIRHERGRRCNNNVVVKSQRLVHVAGYSRATAMDMTVTDSPILFA